MSHKKAKQYPMNGPSLEIQRLMEFPRRNRVRLQQWANSNADKMRPETIEACRVK